MTFLLGFACKCMALWMIVYISHYCEGLGTPAITIKNAVGVLSLLQPTFVGRNVTFEFTPSTLTSIGDVRWYYIEQNGSKADSIKVDDLLVQRDGKSTSFTIPDVDRSLNGASVYTSIGKNGISALLKLNLKVYTNANSCGELYFLSEGPYFAGDNLSLGYFPSPQVTKEKATSKYSVKLTNGSSDNHTSIEQAKGVLELDQVGQEFIFTLFNVKKNDSGSYWVQCLNGYSGKYSNGVHVSIEGKPIIGPLTTLSTCRECIVFKTDQKLGKVNCQTDEEYNATNVKFEIGLFQYASIKLSRNQFGLNSYDKPADAFHHLHAICTVFGIHRNISVKASIFVVVNPNGPPYLSAKEVILEGETVDITCTSSSARPPPLLKFLVNATKIDTNTNVSATLNDSTGLYTSVSKLHSFEKEWGNKNISCEQHPEVNGLYHESMSNSVYILYKYPPLRMNLDVIDQGNPSKPFAVRCSTLDSNPVCNITWETSIENFKYDLHQHFISRYTSVSTISFNVTDVDFGKQITCGAECPDFLNTVSNSTTVIFAKKPSVAISSSSVLPVLPTSHLALTCASNAFPYGNITWQLLNAFNSISSHKKLCLNASTCTYEMIASDVEQEYSCIAENEHGTDRGSIIVTIDKGEPRQNGRGSFLWILLSGIAIVTLGIIVLVLCVFRKRWYRCNTLYEDVNIHQDGQHTYQGIVVPSSNMHHESDAILSPGIYDEIDENNPSTVQAGTNLTTSATDKRQCLIENSNPYSNISQRIPTGTQMTEMTRYFSESNNPGSAIGETNLEGGEDYLHVIYGLNQK